MKTLFLLLALQLGVISLYAHPENTLFWLETPVIQNNEGTAVFSQRPFVPETRGLPEINHPGIDAALVSGSIYYPGWYGSRIEYSCKADCHSDIEENNPKSFSEHCSMAKDIWRFDLSLYTGLYYNPEFETIYRVIWNGDELEAQNRQLEPVKLIYIGDDEFVGKDPLQIVRFERNEEGNICAFKMPSKCAKKIRYVRLPEYPEYFN